MNFYYIFDYIYSCAFSYGIDLNFEHFRTSTGIKLGDLFMSYKSMFQDVRTAVDYVHLKVNSYCIKAND